MSTRKFEAHITMRRDQSEIVKGFDGVLGWSFSAIDGDPVMGKQAYCYLTAYGPIGTDLLVKVQTLSNVLRDNGVEVLREKVEEIVYDSKTGHDVLGLTGK